MQKPVDKANEVCYIKHTKFAKRHSERGDTMSEKDKELMAKIATLPATVKERLCDQVEGAIMMREAMKKEQKEDE